MRDDPAGLCVPRPLWTGALLYADGAPRRHVRASPVLFDVGDKSSRQTLA